MAQVQLSMGDRGSYERSSQAHLLAAGVARHSGCRPGYCMAKVGTRLPGGAQAGKRPQLGLHPTELHLPKHDMDC